MALRVLGGISRRYVIPLGVAVVTAAAVVVPQLASGVQHPTLPARTAAQLLVVLENATVPEFTGTVVETARLGLPSLNESGLGSMGSANGDGPISEAVNLLAGSHSAQIAYGGPQRQRIAIFLDDLSETDVVHNGDSVWTYSSQDNAVSHSVSHDKADAKRRMPTVGSVLDPQQEAQRALKKIDPTTAVNVDRTAEVAGRSAYQLVLTPRNPQSLIGSVRIAIDSATSLPLRVEILARGATGSPAFEVAFTSIHMATPAASTFDFKTPPGAIVESNPLQGPEVFDGGPATRGKVPAGAMVHRQSVFGGSSAERAPTSAGRRGTQVNSSKERETSFRSTGKGWMRVMYAKVSPPSSNQNSGPSEAQMILLAVGNLANRVQGGRLLSTPLFSIFMTNDDRVFIGAVSPSYLEHLAAEGVGK